MKSMRKSFLLLFMSFFSVFSFAQGKNKRSFLCPKTLFSTAHTHLVDAKKITTKKYIWSSGAVSSFDELILSWNAMRPKKGFFTFKVSLFYDGKWSPLKKLAAWGKNMQQTFGFAGTSLVHTKYVRVEMQKKILASQFKIEVTAEKGANLSDLHALFASTSHLDAYKKNNKASHLPSIMIKNVPTFTQWVGRHPRCKDFCSPISMFMMVRYFKKTFLCEDVSHRLTEEELIAGVSQVHDAGLDIYGNWLMNIAHAYQETKGKVFYSVRRLQDFEALHRYLCQKIPVAVSVRGKLKGGLVPYNNGHFIVVIGWDRKKKMVRCIDPAIKDIKQTERWYSYDDFVTAWGRSRNLSYVSSLKGKSIF